MASRTVRRSLGTKLIALMVVFLVVPVLLFLQFRDADLEKREILLETVRDKGAIIAEALKPLLARGEDVPFEQLPDELARFADARVALRLLYRPAKGDGFFFVAAQPPLPIESLEDERMRLTRLGILDQVARTCSGNMPLALRTTPRPGAPGSSPASPPGANTDEVITSITPVATPEGCFALIIANPVRGLSGVANDDPPWSSPEVRLALLIYVVMAVLVGTLIHGLWRSFRRFAQTARTIPAANAGGQSFASSIDIPELAPVARDFDRMVGLLRDSASGIRRAAEDNAHAFKTPIATIRQAHELLSHRAEDPARRAQALGIIEAALLRLEGLVRSARRLDEATADLLEGGIGTVRLDQLAEAVVEEYRGGLVQGLGLVVESKGPVSVLARADLVETMLENLIENALSFSPPGGMVTICVGVQGDMGYLSVEDRGPGIPPDRLARIFDRYYSDRPHQDGANAFPTTDHFGVGLWLVRRHAEALGGAITPVNRPDGGLRMTITLPLAAAEIAA